MFLQSLIFSEQGEEYLVQNGLKRDLARQQVTRSLGDPGQFLSYFVGMVRDKILVRRSISLRSPHLA